MGVEPWIDDTAKPPSDLDFSIHDDVLQHLELNAFPITDSAPVLRSTQGSLYHDEEADPNEDEPSIASISISMPGEEIDDPFDDIVGDSNDEDEDEDMDGRSVFS